MSQNVTKCHTFSNYWYKATFTLYVLIRLGTTLSPVLRLGRWNTRKKERQTLVIIIIPIPQSTLPTHIHPLQNTMHVSKVHCWSAFEPGASRLPYYCTPPVCVPAVLGCVVAKQKQKKVQTNKEVRVLHLRLSTSGTFFPSFFLDKSTWQVALVKLTCHPRLRLLFKSLDKWQLVKSTCQVNLKVDLPKITSARCPRTPPKGYWGGSGHGHGQQNGHIFLPNFFRKNGVLGIILRCSPPREATLRLGNVAAALVDSLQQSLDSMWGETCL